jgi:hypothetical protein
VSFFIVLYMSVLASIPIPISMASPVFCTPMFNGLENIKPHFVAKKSVNLQLADLKARRTSAVKVVLDPHECRVNLIYQHLTAKDSSPENMYQFSAMKSLQL